MAPTQPAQSSSASGGTPAPATMRVCQKAGLHATNCTAAFIAGRRQDIIRESAQFLLALEEIWRAQDMPPAEVWTELLRRLEVSELLHRLNQPPHRRKAVGRRARAWRITTSKLP
ncbi:phosphoribosyl-ATP pyrophosphatase [Acetobacter papayae]|uniref:phosphoribosyl-ATP pyrophosphatase n=1 Tax=Acetobacter papayae TaxID=1076592 RepID=UPI000686BBB2|nr:phosphoribosyl-ATP pyrophosphatase [Acetobacter papayae]